MVLESKYSFRLLSKAKIDELKLTLIDSKTEKEEVESDSKKRSLLKLMGVVGVGALAASILPKKAESLVFGSTPTSNIIGVKNTANQKINPATNEKVDELITELKLKADLTETQPVSISGTIPVSVADTLPVSIASTVPVSVAQTVNVAIPSGAVVSGVVGVSNSTNTRVNPATEDSNVYLRRIVKLMESQAVVDIGNRQRVTIDAMTTGLTLPTVTTVSAVTNMVSLAGQNQQMYQDPARNAYANGIRRYLIN